MVVIIVVSVIVRVIPVVISVIGAVVVPAIAIISASIVGIAITPTKMEIAVRPVPAVIVVIIVPAIGPCREGISIIAIHINVPVVMVIINDLAVKG
jgi:hypothetical protein